MGSDSWRAARTLTAIGRRAPGCERSPASDGYAELDGCRTVECQDFSQAGEAVREKIPLIELMGRDDQQAGDGQAQTCGNDCAYDQLSLNGEVLP